MGYTTCPKCDGDGEMKCPKCGGSAFAHSIKVATNEMFGIKEDKQCSRCHDEFVVACNECGGTGKVKDDAALNEKEDYEDDDDDGDYDDNDYSSSSSYTQSSSYSSSSRSDGFSVFNLVALIVCVIVGLFSFNIGMVHNDGTLFRGFFMQLLAIASGIGTVYFLIRTIFNIKN